MWFLNNIAEYCRPLSHFKSQIRQILWDKTLFSLSARTLLLSAYHGEKNNIMSDRFSAYCSFDKMACVLKALHIIIPHKSTDRDRCQIVN